MAATITSQFVSDTEANLAIETFLFTGDGAATTGTVTPTYIKAIQGIWITPNSSAAATGLTGTYVSTFVRGSGSFVITVPATYSGSFFVTVVGYR